MTKVNFFNARQCCTGKQCGVDGRIGIQFEINFVVASTAIHPHKAHVGHTNNIVAIASRSTIGETRNGGVIGTRRTHNDRATQFIGNGHRHFLSHRNSRTVLLVDRVDLAV